MAIGFFQKRIEEIINNVLSADEATELTTAQLEQISSQLALYFSTVLLTLAGLLFMFFILGWLFRKKNDSASGTDKALHRQHILRDLESQILNLSLNRHFGCRTVITSIPIPFTNFPWRCLRKCAGRLRQTFKHPGTWVTVCWKSLTNPIC